MKEVIVGEYPNLYEKRTITDGLGVGAVVLSRIAEVDFTHWVVSKETAIGETEDIYEF